jgi:hypothetical protein
MAWVHGIVFLLVHQAVFGVYLGCTFAPSHKGMPTLSGTEAADPLLRQVLTSRNVGRSPSRPPHGRTQSADGVSPVPEPAEAQLASAPARRAALLQDSRYRLCGDDPAGCLWGGSGPPASGRGSASRRSGSR